MKKIGLCLVIVLILPIILQMSLRAKASTDAATIIELPSQTLAPEESRTYELLALYALALDTSSLGDLSWAYEGTINGLQEATLNQPNKIALVLVDMPGDQNTFIVEVSEGEATIKNELPDTTGIPTTTFQEYDMTDGAMLGGFLLWARQTYIAEKSTFSYIGHGGPLIPDADWGGFFESPPLRSPPFPLPGRIGLKGSLTDLTPEPSLLSLYSLSEALRIGTDEGTNPLDVVDLVHCFASTIEEYYALYPYTKTMTGSPNYTYYSDEMPGEALSAIDPSAEADEIAHSIIQQYEGVLQKYDDLSEQEDYPRLLVAVDSTEIPLIKQIWDQIAEQIMSNFDRTKLENAYLNSGGYYDTTHCDGDWQLQSPDALVDLDKFAFQLGQEFGGTTNTSVENLQQIISDTIIARYSQNGQPWFANVTPKPYWDFDGNAGIGIYADFAGTPLDLDHDGQEEIHLTWQGHFYTDTAVITNTNGVEVPQYAFLQPEEPNGVTWADVFERFWQDTDNLQFDSCLLDSQTPNMTDLEVTISSFPETVEVGSPLSYLITVTNHSPMTATQTTLFNILPTSVDFIEARASKGVCSERSELTKGITCHLGTINHTDTTTVTITVNPTETRWITNVVNVTNYMPDINVVNNTVTQETFVYWGSQPADLMAPVIEECIVDYGAQTTDQLTVTLTASGTDFPILGASGLHAIRVVELELSLGAEDWIPIQYSPWIAYPQIQESYTWSLLPTYGLRRIQIWGRDNAGNISFEPALCQINLIPSEQEDEVTESEVRVYRYLVEAGEILTAALTPVNGDPDLHIWGPNGERWSSNNPLGVEAVAFETPETGIYQIEIHGYTDADYLLTFGTSKSARPQTFESDQKPLPENPRIPWEEWPETPETHRIYLPLITD